MFCKYIHLCLVSLTLTQVSAEVDKSAQTYEPSWESLDTRPLPEWYDNAKFGIFIHWGVFSVPGIADAWFWQNWNSNSSETVEFMQKNYYPGFTYQDFALEFTAEFFNPDEWAELFQSSGAKYVVLTSKHHEGFTLWPSNVSFSWNAMNIGPKRDLVGELATSIRTTTNLTFGLYHSLYEWYNQLYILDLNSGYSTQLFVKQKTIPELYEIVNTYKPEVIWSDGDWDAPDSYWMSTEFLAWLYNESPVKDTVVVNDRWGGGIMCNHGDFYTCADRYNPGVLQPHKWENAMTIDKYSWGIRRNAKLADYMTTPELIEQLAQTVSCGGNLLMNVGPTKDGIILPIFEERLRDMGMWLNLNGEAIYNSKPWTYQNDTYTNNVWYTQSGDTNQEIMVYAIVLQWPVNRELHLGAPQVSENSEVTLLGVESPLKWSSTDELVITFPGRDEVSNNWAWVIKLTNVIN